MAYGIFRDGHAGGKESMVLGPSYSLPLHWSQQYIDSHSVGPVYMGVGPGGLGC